jgi:hypothetical protein
MSSICHGTWLNYVAFTKRHPLSFYSYRFLTANYGCDLHITNMFVQFVAHIGIKRAAAMQSGSAESGCIADVW